MSTILYAQLHLWLHVNVAPIQRNDKDQSQ